MTTNALRSGDRVGPYELTLGPDLVRAFAETTLDDSPEVRAGLLVPPNLMATQSYRGQVAAMMALVPHNVFSRARSGVHGQHDLVVHRPLAPNDKLHTFVDTHSARPSGDKLRITLHHATFNDDGILVVEQWWTTVLLGTTSGTTGAELPDYSFSGDKVTAVAEDVVRIDGVMARRYADISSDYSDHHFSVEGAKRSGFEAPFLHGLCTMALCTRVATTTVAQGDPRRIRRVAVRFAAPAFLGRDLKIQIFERANGRFALEARAGEQVVIKNGFLELVPRS
jgi:acyl dehydratase